MAEKNTAGQPWNCKQRSFDSKKKVKTKPSEIYSTKLSRRISKLYGWDETSAKIELGYC